MDTTNQLFGGNLPQSIRMPFDLKYITRIYMCVEESWFTKGKFLVRGSVKFQNGNTTGEQNFEADNLSELYMKIQRFCESLR